MTIVIDKKTLLIVCLSLSAALLAVLNYGGVPNARASESIRGDRYTAVTGRIAVGGEALYLTNRDGMMAVFIYDPMRKNVQPMKVASVLEAFNGAGAGGVRRTGR